MQKKKKYIYIYHFYCGFKLELVTTLHLEFVDNFTLKICCKNIVNVTLLKLEPVTTFTPVELASFY